MKFLISFLFLSAFLIPSLNAKITACSKISIYKKKNIVFFSWSKSLRAPFGRRYEEMITVANHLKEGLSVFPDKKCWKNVLNGRYDLITSIGLKKKYHKKYNSVAFIPYVKKTKSDGTTQQLYFGISKKSKLFKNKKKLKRLRILGRKQALWEGIHKKNYRSPFQHTSLVIKPQAKITFEKGKPLNNSIKACWYKHDTFRKKFKEKYIGVKTINILVKKKKEKYYFGTLPETLLRISNELNMELNIGTVDNALKMYKCFEKMKSGEIDMMVHISDKEDRRKYMEMVLLDDGFLFKGPKTYMGISKKSKLISRLDDIKKAVKKHFFQDKYKEIWETTYESQYDHQWREFNFQELLKEGQNKNLKSKCLTKPNEKDIEILRQYIHKTGDLEPIRANFTGTLTVKDCTRKYRGPEHFCKKNRGKVFVEMRNYSASYDSFFFQYDRCSNKLVNIQPKLYFQDDFKLAYNKFLKWKKIAIDKNVRKMEKEIFTKNGIKYSFDWRMSNKYNMNGYLVIDNGSFKTKIDEKWIRSMNVNLRWLVSDKVKNYLKKGVRSAKETKDLFQ